MRVRQVLTTAVLGALAVALAVLFSACGSSSDDSSAADAESGKTKPKIAVVSVTDTDYFVHYNIGFEQAAEDLGLDVEVHNSPNFETSAVAATINAAVATNPDYLIVTAVDSVGLRQPLLSASERGIKVITYDTQVDEPDFVVTYVNADYHEIGKQSGAELGRVMGGDGKALFLSPLTGNEDYESLEEGFSEALPAGVTELPAQYDQAENSKANSIVRATLTREPDLTGISTTSVVGAEGVIAALREAGKVGQVKLVLQSATKFGIEALRKGEVQVIVSEALEEIAERAVEAAYEDANGTELPEKVTVPICTITAETVDDPENARCLH